MVGPNRKMGPLFHHTEEGVDHTTKFGLRDADVETVAKWVYTNKLAFNSDWIQFIELQIQTKQTAAFQTKFFLPKRK